METRTEDVLYEGRDIVTGIEVVRGDIGLDSWKESPNESSDHKLVG